jgi:hypothetical protein
MCFRLGTSRVTAITRRHLFNMMQQQNLPNMSEKLEFVKNYLLTHNAYLEEERKEIKHNFSPFKSELKRRWIAAHKKEEFLSTSVSQPLSDRGPVIFFYKMRARGPTNLLVNTFPILFKFIH